MALQSTLAAPPPIQRRQPASVGSSSSAGFSKPSAPLPPPKSPLRLRPEPLKTSRPPRNYSHPFKEQLLRRPNPVPYRNPKRPLSYRSNSRLPPSLRRWSSLETIESVTTTASTQDETPRDEPDYPDAEMSPPSSIFLEEDSSLERPSAPSSPSLAHSSDSSSVQSTLRSNGSNKHSVSSMFRKLKPGKSEEPLLLPEHLEIEKRVSIDQRSMRTNSSSSIMTISSGRPSEVGYPSSEGGSISHKSQSSKDWKASSYDTRGLSDADLKKCKKKGINPALYAEMKAARKGKCVSPIGGNTFL